MGAGASATQSPESRALHNPITRVAAGVATGGMSEVYYTPRDVAIAARHAARGRPGRAVAGLIAGEVADGLFDAGVGHEHGGEFINGVAELRQPERDPFGKYGVAELRQLKGIFAGWSMTSVRAVAKAGWTPDLVIATAKAGWTQTSVLAAIQAGWTQHSVLIAINKRWTQDMVMRAVRDGVKVRLCRVQCSTTRARFAESSSLLRAQPGYR